MTSLSHFSQSSMNAEKIDGIASNASIVNMAITEKQ